MEKPHYYIPSGLPPGASPMVEEDGPPPGVYYYRIYAGIQAAFAALSVLGGIVLMIAELAAPPGAGGTLPASSNIESVIAGVFYTGIGAAFFVPLIISLFAGRAAWVHTLGTVLLAVSMLSLCCVPFGLPVLITWLKPETKRWYGAS
jgi:hypothetical protein